MSEIIDFDKEMNKRTWLSHLVLESSKEICAEIAVFTSYLHEFTLEIKLNDVVLPYKDFSQLLTKMSDVIENHYKVKCKLMERESAIREKAEELIKDKLSNAYSVLEAIENSMWKLEE